MNEKTIPKTLPGFMELLPNEQIIFEQLRDKIRRSYECCGFLPLDTPIMEYAQVLLAKTGGDTAKQVYSFNKGDTALALRFDLTVPLAKYVSMYQNRLVFPFKRYQIGKVYRGERPQQGRFREFYQCDIDIIGKDELSILQDAELINVINFTFKNLDIDDFTIFLNNRKILCGLFEHLKIENHTTEILRIIDKKNTIDQNSVAAELKKIGVGCVDTIIDYMYTSGTTADKLRTLHSMGIENKLFLSGLSELEQVIEAIEMFGCSSFELDLTIARGLDYYTGTVYETFFNNHKEIGSICSGGRYDNLSNFYIDKKMPGVGASVGLTRLFYQMNAAKMFKSSTKLSITDVLIIPMTADLRICADVASILRNQGINTEIFVEDKKIRTKFDYANKLNIPFVLIIGKNEIETQRYSLRNMQTGEQQLFTLDEVIDKLKIF